MIDKQALASDWLPLTSSVKNRDMPCHQTPQHLPHCSMMADSNKKRKERASEDKGGRDSHNSKRSKVCARRPSSPEIFLECLYKKAGITRTMYSELLVHVFTWFGSGFVVMKARSSFLQADSSFFSLLFLFQLITMFWF